MAGTGSQVESKVSDIESIIQLLERLQINEQCQQIVRHRNLQGAILPYQKKMDPQKKQKVPKVDLDPETIRMWNLLMEKDASELPKDTEEEKRTNWEEQRELFRKRVEVFISCMHVIQVAVKANGWCVLELRRTYCNLSRTPGINLDAVDWDAVRRAPVEEIAKIIESRGMNNVLAAKIKAFLQRLVHDHGSIDLEWLKDIPPDKAKEFLLSIRGVGLKSTECVRLLTLGHLAFPVDTNIARIAVRLGWVPLEPLPGDLQIHLLEQYPQMDAIQKYLWPRLCSLDKNILYVLHYQLITFGKVICTKKNPNCNACPLRAECRHLASAFARGDNRNLLKLKVTLDIYLKATGQEINLNKSRFYTSKHTTSSQNQHMEKALGIKRGNLPFTYLGAPIFHTIPKSIIHTLNRYMANFLWGQKEGSHKHHWVRWAQITKPEVEGGLGIKSLKDLQQAHTLKLWWKARNDIGIWGPYVRASYMKTGIMKERITDSPTWKRICRCNDLATSHTTTTSSGLLWEGGNFSLKSAFNMVKGSGTNLLSCKYIWHSSNIPKIKIFLWRTLSLKTYAVSRQPFPVPVLFAIKITMTLITPCSTVQLQKRYRTSWLPFLTAQGLRRTPHYVNIFLHGGLVATPNTSEETYVSSPQASALGPCGRHVTLIFITQLNQEWRVLLKHASKLSKLGHG
ncbi:unnamed protein product [Cuscuta campestris]|uniref:HhH-GPD domain-containing protein n=1 Tax=Cuscuta campestris TaxID=132261 RepID=A0A484NDS8_9ASTE|nr:unnamed protein product [Cuscuta campestris]